MTIFVLFEIDYGSLNVLGVFDSVDKARAYKYGRELEILEGVDACQVTYEIQEWDVL